MFFSKALTLASVAALAYAAPVRRSTGPGIQLNNKGTLTTEYCLFNNIWNGDGTAGPNFSTAQQCLTLAPGASQFVPLDSSFKGRVQRTQWQPATWVEFQTVAANDGASHGDVSIEQGSDGPATIASTDGTNVSGGFTNEIVPGAPAGATTVRSEDGQTVLASTMGNWLGGPNTAASSYAASVLDASATYITGGTGVADVASHNQILEVSFY